MTNNESLEAFPIHELLVELEGEMTHLGVWADRPPAPDAFLSQQPFAYDTMSLPEWMQFIFLPKMHELIESESPLPSRCGIAPMAEEFFKTSTVDISRLLMILNAIDACLGGLAEN
ncbi:YqcC family protein [Litoribrevibacter euphylliae]|uniref:YqcC family protein n=1 Tax=Litoribrevibacter euphylliae TaxID=1834034 RepID=A0ABV7H908_9GAMM